MSINYKNVVSVQRGITQSASGYTYAVAGGSPADIIKHKGFIFVPDASTTVAGTVFPSFFGPDGNALAGHTLSVGGAAGSQVPLEIPLRMKSFTGLTGGSILFVV